MSDAPSSFLPQPPHPALTPEERKTDRRLAWGMFVIGFIVLAMTERAAGFVRDESVYFYAGESYAHWVQALMTNPSSAVSDAEIVKYWDVNHEHPVGMKLLFGLSQLLFTEKLKWARPAMGFRIPAFAIAALLLPLVFFLARPWFGRKAAIFSAAVWLLVPRQFFESHLACFDVPVATMWVLVVYLFWESLTRPRWWVWTGVAFGGALAAKHNAYFIPATLIPFSLYLGWKASAGHARARRLFVSLNAIFIAAVALYAVMIAALGLPKFQQTFLFPSAQLAIFVCTVGGAAWLLRELYKTHVETFRTIAPLVAMAALGPVIFYVHWPYLWHHPVDRAAWYFAFHATHNHYAWFYMGELLRGPPFPLEYVLVKTALTVPTTLFVPMVFGFAFIVMRVFRKQATVFDALLAVSALTSIAIISHPTVPHFGGVKHWFPSMPFLAILAGGSVVRGARGLSEWLQQRGKAFSESTLTWLLMVLLAIPAVIQSVRVYPYGTSHYSELAGGLPGAASLGMQRQFWANNVTGILDWLNANAKMGARVYFHENHNLQTRDYQRNGMVRPDIVFVGDPFQADIVAYQYMQEFREHEFNAWTAFGTTVPVTGLYVDQTPQIVVYQRQ